VVEGTTRVGPGKPGELPVFGGNRVDPAAHPYLAVIIKPTYDCNLACEYCSVYGCEPAPRMSRETVDILMDRVTEFCGTARTIFLIWHGGEPLLLPPEFYDYIGRRTLQYTGHSILNSVQTNATLLDRRYLDVFLKYGFDISISLDGPEALHDSGRKDPAGNGTFRTVMNAVSLLQSKGLPVGGVAVLTRKMIGRMREIYDFFNGQGLHLRINPVQKQGRADAAYEQLSITPRQYGEQMIELFNIWYSDPAPRIVIDPLRIIMGNIVHPVPDCCDFRRECHAEIISVGPRGEVYPCGQFNGFEEYYFGNIHRDTFADMMSGPASQALLTRVPENLPECSRCEFHEICNCGCTVSALINRGRIMDPDFYCEGRKMLFAHILKTLENDFLKAGKSRAPVPQTV
jgi:uncharacterized protein